MKKKEERLEKEMAEVQLQRKRLTEPLQKAKEDVAELQKKLANYEKDKASLAVHVQQLILVKPTEIEVQTRYPICCLAAAVVKSFILTIICKVCICWISALLFIASSFSTELSLFVWRAQAGMHLVMGFDRSPIILMGVPAENPVV